MEPDNIFDEEPEPFGIENLIELARQIKDLDDAKLRDSKRNLFFRHALYSYYDCDDCMGGGLTAEAGDIVYRLSDLLPDEERRRIQVYPKRNGKIIVDSEGSIYGFSAWESLEEWRKGWKKQRPVIPELFILLEPGQADYLSQF